MHCNASCLFTNKTNKYNTFFCQSHKHNLDIIFNKCDHSHHFIYRTTKALSCKKFQVLISTYLIHNTLLNLCGRVNYATKKGSNVVGIQPTYQSYCSASGNSHIPVNTCGITKARAPGHQPSQILSHTEQYHPLLT